MPKIDIGASSRGTDRQAFFCAGIVFRGRYEWIAPSSSATIVFCAGSAATITAPRGASPHARLRELMEGQWCYEACAASLSVIASPARLAILFRLLESPHSRKELVMRTQFARTTLGHHLERLQSAGVVALNDNGDYFACGDWIEVDGRRAWRIVLPPWQALFFV